MVAASDGVLGSSICSAIREVFLEGVIRPGIMNDDEDLVTLYTALITKIIYAITAPMLVSCE